MKKSLALLGISYILTALFAGIAAVFSHHPFAWFGFVVAALFVFLGAVIISASRNYYH